MHCKHANHWKKDDSENIDTFAVIVMANNQNIHEAEQMVNRVWMIKMMIQAKISVVYKRDDSRMGYLPEIKLGDQYCNIAV